jgi:uncharacterized protein YndB with AHSA1/START domain
MTDRLTIAKVITVEADPARVFTALTTPSEIVQYFPYREVEASACEGGAITFRGELGGQPFTDYGEITVWRPGHEFAYKYWSDNHGTPRTPENHLTIRYLLAPASSGGTRVEVEHANVPAGPYAEMMEGAWDGLLRLLAAHLTSTPGEA